MNKYIKEIKHTNCEVTDSFERMMGKTIRYAITVMLNRTSENKCFKLHVDNVSLKNELGRELPLVGNLDGALIYNSTLHFYFDIDPDFCELQEQSVFEITLHEAWSSKQENFRYVLSNHTWEEVAATQP